jgi:hypothetical protein
MHLLNLHSALVDAVTVNLDNPVAVAVYMQVCEFAGMIPLKDGPLRVTSTPAVYSIFIE